MLLGGALIIDDDGDLADTADRAPARPTTKEKTMRYLIALALIATLLAGGSTPAAADSGPWLTNDTSLCGSLFISATGLAPNTVYQLVADGGYPDVVHTVTTNAYGSAFTTVLRSEASSDSSADWGNTWVRTQYGGYIASNVSGFPPTAHPPAYHFCR